MTREETSAYYLRADMEILKEKIVDAIKNNIPSLRAYRDLVARRADVDSQLRALGYEAKWSGEKYKLVKVKVRK